MARRNVLFLNNEVLVSGLSFWGKRRFAHFVPRNNGLDWCWRYPVDSGNVLPIDVNCIKVHKRQFGLTSEHGELSVYEHLGALRHIVGGLEINSGGWLPYDGCSALFLNAIKRNASWKEIEAAVYGVGHCHRFTYPGPRGGQKAYTEIRPAEGDERLILDISCSFKGLGSGKRTFVFPNEKLFDLIVKTKTLGWPKWAYHLSKVFDWSHHHDVIWPQTADPDTIMDKILYHRALDLLGALSLLCKDGFFAGHVISVNSGHLADVKAVMMANEHLKLI